MAALGMMLVAAVGGLLVLPAFSRRSSAKSLGIDVATRMARTSCPRCGGSISSAMMGRCLNCESPEDS